MDSLTDLQFSTNLFDNNSVNSALGYEAPSNSPFIESSNNLFSNSGSNLGLAQEASKGLGLLDFALPGLGTALSVGVGGILGHLSSKYQAKQAAKLAQEERAFTLQQLAMKMALEKQIAAEQAAVAREQIGAQKEIAAQGNLNNAYSNSVDAAISGAQVGNSSIGNFLRAIGR